MTTLSIILPTYNEVENLPNVIARIESTLGGSSSVNYEIVVVDDDSPDGTWRVGERLARTRPYLRVIRRVHRRGLASAILDGFLAGRGEYLIVMDADLQHDESALRGFVEQFQSGADLVIGTRKAEGGRIESWSALRRLISWSAARLSDFVLPQEISDPMSGFFGIRKDRFEEVAHRINPRGFKLLLELLVAIPDAEIGEVGYTFRPRQHGQSKLSGSVAFDYIVALYDLKFGRWLPVRFLKFGLVGLSGVAVNQGTVWMSRSAGGLDPRVSVALGIEVSILSNFFLNNFWTFRDYAFQGFRQTTVGMSKFHVVCLTGALINFAVAVLGYEKLGVNLYLANLFGIILAAVWNYRLSLDLTWRIPEPEPR